LVCFVEQGVRLKSIGKAVTKGTKKIGKTLTTMAESPDKRGQERFAKINAPQFYEKEKKGNLKDVAPASAAASLGMDTGTYNSSIYCMPFSL
jgi:hypothetical protein